MKKLECIILIGCAALLLKCGGNVSLEFPIGDIEETPTPLPNEVVVFEETFESGNLNFWEVLPDGTDRINIQSGAGIDSSYALSVDIAQSAAYIRNGDSARFIEGYLDFNFNPNSANIPDIPSVTWPPGKSIQIVQFQGVELWNTLVALYLRKTSEGEYRAYLKWDTPQGGQYDYEEGEFILANDWQNIRIGFKANSWVGVWLNGKQVRMMKDISHDHIAGHNVFIGQINNTNTAVEPQGNFLFDNVSVYLPFRKDIWVDSAKGRDNNSGLTQDQAVRTIQKGLDLVSPGTTVHIQPGIYRESLNISVGGTQEWPVTIKAEQGAGTVIVRGSASSKDMIWTRLENNTIGLPSGVTPNRIFYANLASFGLTEAPRFVVSLDDSSGNIFRMPLAREPDRKIGNEWKHHEYFWAADGGDMVETCTPEPGNGRCDCPNPDNPNYCPSRSFNMLTDITDDTDPIDIEPGNLSTLGDITGATLWVLDTVQGHNFYKREIINHDVSNGRITLDSDCIYSWREALGWGSKYYVENHPALLDNPGEWWFDPETQNIYIWPATPTNPSNLDIEISYRNNGIDLRNRSYVSIDGLNIEFVNNRAISIYNPSNRKSESVTLKNMHMRYGNYGVYLNQMSTLSEEYRIEGFVLKNSLVEHMDTRGLQAIYYWGSGYHIANFKYPGVTNTVIRDNEFSNLGFRSDLDYPVGLSFAYADNLKFERNLVRNTAHCGTLFWSAIDSGHKNRDFLPEEIKTGNILVKDNIFEKACQLNADCGAIKIGGDPATGDAKHVFRDFLIVGNIFRNTFGWTYITEKRGGRWAGSGSQVKGMGGFGLYVDYASGIHAYRNIAYNNGYINYHMYGYWRDGEMIYYNNISANSVYGFNLSSNIHASVPAVNLEIKNNIILNSEGYGIMLRDQEGLFENVDINNNLYFSNGWRSNNDGGLSWPGNMLIVIEQESGNQYRPYHTLEDIREDTVWEHEGSEGNPLFADYDIDDHDMFDASWPNFALTTESILAIDSGSEIPESLSRLLSVNSIENPKVGGAWDIGFFEHGIGRHDGDPTLAGTVIASGCSSISNSSENSAGFWIILMYVLILVSIRTMLVNRR